MNLKGKEKPEDYGFKLVKREESYETLLHPDEKQLYIRWINRQSITPVLMGFGSQTLRIVFQNCDALEIKNASWENLKDIVYYIKKEKLTDISAFKKFITNHKKLKHLKTRLWALHFPGPDAFESKDYKDKYITWS